jgi:hypothetical protein
MLHECLEQGKVQSYACDKALFVYYRVQQAQVLVNWRLES